MTIKEVILKKGEDDWVYLAEVAALVQQQMPDAAERAIVEPTLNIVRELVESGLMVVGDLSGARGRFSPWRLSTADALEKIREQWLSLNRSINIGDVCWLANTSEGDKLAATLPGI